MGTRGDFYVGRGKSAEWIGSIAFDGFPEDVDDRVRDAETEEDFRGAVASFFLGRDDATLPEMGWPWPWDDSSTSDFAYAFDGGQVLVSSFGSSWVAIDDYDPDIDPVGEVKDFPKMDTQRAAIPGSSRSGIFAFE